MPYWRPEINSLLPKNGGAAHRVLPFVLYPRMRPPTLEIRDWYAARVACDVCQCTYHSETTNYTHIRLLPLSY